MSERDELKSQALRVLLDADEAHAPEGPMWPELAGAIVNAGWRPPPSGDVIEQALDHMWHDEDCEHPRGGACDCLTRNDAHKLADAGLLRVEPDVIHVHHHDIEAHAKSFNEGFDEAMGLRWPVLGWMRRWFQ